MSDQSTPPQKLTLWTFLNSKFGLLIFSSIVVFFITNSYSTWTARNEAKVEVLQEKLKILSEINYRIYVIDYEFSRFNAFYRREHKLALIQPIQKAFNGTNGHLLYEHKLVKLFADYLTKEHDYLQDSNAILENLLDIDFDLVQLARLDSTDQLKLMGVIDAKYKMFKRRIGAILQELPVKINDDYAFSIPFILN